MASKTTYEDAFSGRTKAILRTLTNIFLDSGFDVRSKHMFGHKAFLLQGRPFLLVGEWARDEDKKGKIVRIADRGTVESTVIVIPPTEEMAKAILKNHGGLYFAPSGTRLKFWISLTGLWLTEEDEVLSLIQLLMETYAAMPENSSARPGRRV